MNQDTRDEVLYPEGLAPADHEIYHRSNEQDLEAYRFWIEAVYDPDEANNSPKE